MSEFNVGNLSVTITADTAGINRGINNANRKLKQSNAALQKNEKAWSRWGTAVRVAAAAAVALTAREIVQLSDSFTSINNKLKIATAHTGDFATANKKLFDIAQESRTSWSSTVDLYAKMERATRGAGMSQERLLGVTKSIGKAFQIGGATAQEATGAIRQLGQALASGTLRGDEFNSVAEQAPVIMEAVKLATGKTAGELRELAAEGALTSEVMIESIERYAKTIDQDFATATKTYAQKLEVARNNAIKFVGGSDSLTESVSNLGDAAVSLSENLEAMATTAAVVGTVITSRVAGPFLLAKGAMAATAIQATLASAKLMIVGQSANFVGPAMSRAMIATRGLSSAMALLGGPVGVLITVAASLALFVDWESKAEKATKKTNDEIKAQSSELKKLEIGQLKDKFDEMRTASVQAALKLIPLTDKLGEIESKINAPLAGSSMLGMSSQSFDELTKKAEKLRAKIAELKAIQKKGAAGAGEAEALIAQLESTENERIKLEKKQTEAQAKRAADKKARDLESANNAIEALRLQYATEEELEIAKYSKSIEKLQKATEEKIQLMGAEGERAAEIQANADAIAIGLKEEHNKKMEEIRIGDSEKKMEQIRQSLATEAEIEKADFEKKVEDLTAWFALNTEKTTEFHATLEALKADHEAKMTDIAQKSADKQAAIDKAAKLKKINDAQQGANQILALTEIFGGKSKKQQKRMRRAQVAIDTAAGVMKAFATAPDIFSAIGMAAMVVRQGKKSLDSINSESVGGKAVSAPTQQAPQQAQQQNNENTQRAISINMVGGSMFSGDQVRELIEQINGQLGDGVELAVGG